MNNNDNTCANCIIQLFVTYNALEYIKNLFAKKDIPFPDEKLNDIYNVKEINKEFFKKFHKNPFMIAMGEHYVNCFISGFITLAEKEGYEKALFKIFEMVEV